MAAMGIQARLESSANFAASPSFRPNAHSIGDAGAAIPHLVIFGTVTQMRRYARQAEVIASAENCESRRPTLAPGVQWGGNTAIIGHRGRRSIQFDLKSSASIGHERLEKSQNISFSLHPAMGFSRSSGSAHTEKRHNETPVSENDRVPQMG